jgi:hypothetical protein
MILQVRTARPEINMNGKDYFSSLAPYFLSMQYSDNCDGEKADDLQLHLADRDKRFINDWMPDVGVFVDVSIIAERWFSPNAAVLKLDCGRFWLDSVDFNMPDNTVTIKGNSIPTDCQIKTTNETRHWDKTTLDRLVNQIANENKLQPNYLAQNKPKYAAIEQQEESSLQFLKKRCDDAKLALRIHKGELIVYDEEELEKVAPKFTLIYGTDKTFAFGDFGSIGLATYRISGGSLKLKLTDVQKGHKVAHTSAMTGKTTAQNFSVDDQGIPSWDNNMCQGTDGEDEEEDSDDEGPPETREGGDVIPDWQNNTGGSFAVKAKADTRKANKDKMTGEFQLSIGNPLVAAGQTFNLQGCGKYDGAWFIEGVDHTCGPEFKTTINAHKCLQGY